jgi:hypothetical protein
MMAVLHFFFLLVGGGGDQEGRAMDYRVSSAQILGQKPLLLTFTLHC